jgi:hypothetical protein
MTSPLGNTTVFTANSTAQKPGFSFENQGVTRSEVDPETGEIRSFETFKGREVEAYDQDAALIERWMLLRAAQRLLGRKGDFEAREKTTLAPYQALPSLPMAKRFAKHCIHGPLPQPTRSARHDLADTVNWAPKFRTVLCHRRTVPGESASVWRSTLNSKASFHGLTVCGSPWTCPVCSRKINLGRRDQIKRAYELMDAEGGASYLVTFTIPHGRGDDVSELLDLMRDAEQIMQKSRKYRDLTRKKPLVKPRADSVPFMDYLGRVSALEVTHGQNGFHPHSHQLWCFKRRLNSKQFLALNDHLYAEWAKACEAVGLPKPSRKHGVDIRVALTAADYLTKFGHERHWGLEKELAGSHVKKANFKGRTPLQLLADYANGDAQSGELFRAFAHAFKGRHQIQFSRSLMAFCRDHGCDLDQDDQALAEAHEENSKLLLDLDESDLRRIYANCAWGLVLAYAQRNDADAVSSFIRSFSLQAPEDREAAFCARPDA